MENSDKKPEKAESGKKKSRLKRGIIITVAALTGLSAAAVVAAKEGYDYAFRRYDRPDYNLCAGAYCIERYNGSLIRNELSFYSGGVKLAGYYYPCQNAKGLTVICHGIHSGADDYLPMAEYMVRNGYAVFSFDYRGTYSSEGEGTVGMCQSLVDLDNALNHIESSPVFSGMPVYLIGHSWGGYAVASVLSLHKNISGVACIAAPNSGYTLILEKGNEYGGVLASKGVPELFLNTYHKILFKDYINYDAVKGINSTDIPILLAHGVDDDVIKMDKQGIVAHKDELRTQNVTYFITDGALGGHNSLWHSPAAVEYAKEVDQNLQALKKRKASYKERAEYISGVDHLLYSAVNEQLFEAIVAMFDGGK